MAAPAPRPVHTAGRRCERETSGMAISNCRSRSGKKTRAVDRMTEPPSSKKKMADRRVLEIMPIWRGTGRFYGAGGEDVATSSLQSNRWSAAMPQPNDLSRSRVALDHNISQNRAVDSRLAGRGCKANNGRNRVRRCRARRVAPYTASPDSTRDRSLRKTAPNVCTTVAEGQNRTSPQCRRLRSGSAGSLRRAKRPR